MRGIFVSYRREDAPQEAMLIAEHLRSAFSARRVFLDQGSIEAGSDFSEEIARSIGDSDVMVVVIGRRWGDLLKERAPETDYVVKEISVALDLGLEIVPVFINGAVTPPAETLPDAIAPLATRQAFAYATQDYQRSGRAGEPHGATMVSAAEPCVFRVRLRKRGRLTRGMGVRPRVVAKLRPAPGLGEPAIAAFRNHVRA